MRKLTLVALLLAGCGTDAGQTSIEIPFNLLATDELTGSSAGMLCGFMALTQAIGNYKESGFLEMDPAINPGGQYTLGLQVENYLDMTILTDSNGNTIVGANRNDFHIESALVNYIDTEGALTPIPKTRVLVSGTARPGGEQNATSIIVQAVTNSVFQTWQSSFMMSNLASENVVLAIQLSGVLGSGEPVSSGIFHFPITLCFDCGGVSPAVAAGHAGGCPTGMAVIASGHGPCCAPQDFTAVCLPCGNVGQPCCSTAGMQTCVGLLTCSGTPMLTTSEVCPYPNSAGQVCAKPTM